jgi:hypothetical protein
MPLRDLVDLASALKIAVPMAAKTIRRREPKAVAPPAPETATPPRPPSGSASLHRRPAMAAETRMH